LLIFQIGSCVYAWTRILLFSLLLWWQLYTTTPNFLLVEMGVSGSFLPGTAKSHDPSF
jgi:hypothetical protein